jgi:hypothetical protein
MRCNGMSRPIFLNCLAKRTIEYKGHSMHLSFAVQWCIASDCAATSLRARAFTHTHNAKNSNETQKTCKKTCGSERAWNHAPAMKYRQGGQRHAVGTGRDRIEHGLGNRVSNDGGQTQGSRVLAQADA